VIAPDREYRRFEDRPPAGWTLRDSRLRRRELRDARLAALGGRAVATTVIVAQTLSKNWLVQIEAVAAG
jgi:hypothetical protein